ncbi:VOC family protein [Streptomyces sp. NPDC006134]|uniref:VOC family protein n=1 Tax=Streptomyces sp. NPDC006134 TaxID=3154467 RepID=UPI0033CABBC6
MTVTFNHTIIAAEDRHRSARFFRDLLERPAAPSWGPFVNIQLDDDLFDRAYARLRERGIEHGAVPQMTRPGETNTGHGGRGVYFKDPAGHAIELITRPYL